VVRGTQQARSRTGERRWAPHPSASARDEERSAMEKALRILSYVVLALMLLAALYAGGIGITYWTGIGV
jgi:hypothetical protein